jgi:4'-phosphopantetheinyl transferase
LGKPRLIPASGGDILTFNLTHSDGVALYALTRDGNIGVDLELVREGVESGGTAELLFSPGELLDYERLPANLKLKAFFQCWTRKEAIFKATGTGLSSPLRAINLTVDPREPPAILHLGGSGHNIEEWTLIDLAIDPNYVGAIAVDGRVSELSLWQWTEDIYSKG